MRIVSISNQKGGVGKTTTTMALGAALALRGLRVLVVDLDPQGSLTAAAGVELGDGDHALKTLMSHYLATQQVPPLADCTWLLEEGLDLLPTTIDLAACEFALHQAPRREYVLAKILAATGSYDRVLIDCPPSPGLLTQNALTAADAVLIPLVPEYLAARGLVGMLDAIDLVRRSELNAKLAVAGVILTMVDPRTSHGRQTREEIAGFLGGRIPILGEVKRSVKAAEAAAAGQSILRYAGRSELARAYSAIAEALCAPSREAAYA
jgi:chromosome partitioning protein